MAHLCLFASRRGYHKQNRPGKGLHCMLGAAIPTLGKRGRRVSVPFSMGTVLHRFSSLPPTA
jgi:hypothetical protein